MFLAYVTTHYFCRCSENVFIDQDNSKLTQQDGCRKSCDGMTRRHEINFGHYWHDQSPREISDAGRESVGKYRVMVYSENSRHSIFGRGTCAKWMN